MVVRKEEVSTVKMLVNLKTLTRNPIEDKEDKKRGDY